MRKDLDNYIIKQEVSRILQKNLPAEKYFQTIEKITKEITEFYDKSHSQETKLIDIQKELEQKNRALAERVKELKCLYGIAKLMQQNNMPVSEFLQSVLNLIPPSWQYPDITCARIQLDGNTYSTNYFNETSWKLSSKIYTNKKERGLLEVIYLEENLKLTKVLSSRKNELYWIRLLNTSVILSHRKSLRITCENSKDSINQ